MISAVDAHACGEPGRVIVGGVLDVPGASMFEKMRYLAEHQDGLRQRMLARAPRLSSRVLQPDSAADACGSGRGLRHHGAD